jgi:hypothetical protein
MATLKFGDTGSCPARYKTQEFIGIPREIKNGVYQMPTKNFTFSLPSDATDVGDKSLQYIFYNCTGLTSVDLSSLTTVSSMSGFSNAFFGCTGLISVDLSALTTVSGAYAFSSAFYNCTGLTNISFPALSTLSNRYIFSNVFTGCTNLTDIYFPALTTRSFGSSYKNQFSSMMSMIGTTKTHTIHFPSNLQSTISRLTGYPLFSGTSGYVVLSFDLPATS